MKKEVRNGLNKHPVFREKRTSGQKAADKITTWAGSWAFILIFF